MGDSDMKITTRKEALEKNLASYFTGKPCKRGHIAKRYIASSNCSVCACEHGSKKIADMTDEQKAERRAIGRKSAAKNKHKMADYYAKYRAENKESESARQKAWYERNKSRLAPIRKANREKNREAQRRWYKKYYDQNKESILSKRLERDRNNPNRKHITLIRTTLHAVRAAKVKTRQSWAENICGFTRDELISHITPLLRPGMEWSNYGEWIIDHIKPVSAFLSDGITDPSVVSSLDNLQPLWLRENIQKGNTFSHQNTSKSTIA